MNQFSKTIRFDKASSAATDLSNARFGEPAQNDAEGQCLHCGRDNRGHEGEPCIDECPLYWEARGLAWGEAA